MEWIQDVPVWLLAFLIFFSRVVDMSIGTLRTLMTVAGNVKISMIMGFFESFVWLLAISQTVARIDESPILPFFYAGGFASGIGVGLWLEKQLGFGQMVVRIISREHGEEIARKLRDMGRVLTTFTGEGRDGPVIEIYLICKSKVVKQVLAAARELEPNLFYVVERANDWRHERRAIGFPTGWRGVQNRK